MSNRLLNDLEEMAAFLKKLHDDHPDIEYAYLRDQIAQFLRERGWDV